MSRNEKENTFASIKTIIDNNTKKNEIFTCQDILLYAIILPLGVLNYLGTTIILKTHNISKISLEFHSKYPCFQIWSISIMLSAEIVQ